jgi:hypothetical protein
MQITMAAQAMNLIGDGSNQRQDIFFEIAMTSTVVQSRRCGLIGSIFGLLALIAAVLPHWVVPVLFPPPPIDQMVVDTGHRVKERLIARMKHVEYQAPRAEPSLGDRLSEGSSVAAVSLGLLAVALAVFALVFREERMLAGVSATLGLLAIAVEISFFILGGLLLIAIIYIVLNHIDLV